MNRKLVYFALLQLSILFGLIWFIAGNDRLFRSAVPIEQRLVDRFAEADKPLVESLRFVEKKRD